VAADFLERTSNARHHYPNLSIPVFADPGDKQGTHFPWVTETAALHAKVNFWGHFFLTFEVRLL
jgi:hypothetical protein